ncbi:MAG: hypothetical protein P8179_21745 [Candidatus Thiodiazotropha sp.]
MPETASICSPPLDFRLNPPAFAAFLACKLSSGNCPPGNLSFCCCTVLRSLQTIPAWEEDDRFAQVAKVARFSLHASVAAQAWERQQKHKYRDSHRLG